MNTDEKEIFRRGSKTYFNSSVFFPDAVRNDVFTLYAFVRTADDFVDATPQDAAGFYAFRDAWRESEKGRASGNGIIDNFVALSRRRRFDPRWTEAFLYSMELDLKKKIYHTLDETLEYIYGSAEVIGLYMAQLLRLPDEAHYPARMLGRAMQYINFIRDIDEDNGLGRRYLPADNGPAELTREYALANRDEFAAYVRAQSALYLGWQKEAEEGYRFIPRRCRIPVKTAGDMYIWTAREIMKNPLVVFERKVKPSRGRIIRSIAFNTLFSR